MDLLCFFPPLKSWIIYLAYWVLSSWGYESSKQQFCEKVDFSFTIYLFMPFPYLTNNLSWCGYYLFQLNARSHPARFAWICSAAVLSPGVIRDRHLGKTHASQNHMKIRKYWKYSSFWTNRDQSSSKPIWNRKGEWG